MVAPKPLAGSAGRRRALFLATLAIIALIGSAPRAACFPGPVGDESRVVPPPRTVDDIAVLLEQYRHHRPEFPPETIALADGVPPATDDPDALARFHFRRAQAAVTIGRARQTIDDLTQAAHFAEIKSRGSDLELQILNQLWGEEALSGNQRRAIAYLERAVSRVPASGRGWLIVFYSHLARAHATSADLDAAEAALQQAVRVHGESKTWKQVNPTHRASWEALVAIAHAPVLELKGRFSEAATFYRQAVWIQSSNAALSSSYVEIFRARLARSLAWEGRLLEAEVEARRAVLGALRRYGWHSPRTANVLRHLALALFEQGRYPEAEALTRVVLEIFEQTGASSRSALTVTEPRRGLIAALVAQGRWAEALTEYDTFRRSLDDDDLFRSLTSTPNVILALLKGGRLDTAAALIRHRLESTVRPLGPRGSAEYRALLGMLRAAQGDRAGAVREFAAAVPDLLNRSAEIDDELTTKANRGQRRRLMLDSYIDLLMDIRGTPLEREVGRDAADEAFRIAEVVRSRVVQQALNAGAARSAAATPALAELVRQDQDARRSIEALHRRLNGLLGRPHGVQDDSAVAALTAQVEALRLRRRALAEQIEQGFPAYAQLVEPAPPAVDEVRARLRPGEALIATYTTDERTLVWAIPHTGKPAFAAVPLGKPALAALVGRVRHALDSSASTVGDIPAFDLAAAHAIYAKLLEPVKDAWMPARDLLIVMDGPLAQLPLSVLPTRPTLLTEDRGSPFSAYRAVPWLARTHTVTVLPAVSSLVTLSEIRSRRADHRPFVGFGDPLFSRDQAEPPRQELELLTPAPSWPDVTITLRTSPRAATLSSAGLARLPRLPETAEEIRSMARTLGADLERDVLLRERASEGAVRTMDLSRYRVVAFATHGLVPGEIDGLLEPALALSAPAVAGGDGDGLLTVEKILSLRLDADWVVLSACNTASGHGAGADAVSGLGRAFFYAGARALLVSNWPVETTSARWLMTELFRHRQPGISRAESLRQAMVAMIDGPGFIDPRTGQTRFTYAHPLFWAPFTIVGDGRGSPGP